MESSHYVGLDVSQELTSVCVIDEQGAVVWRGKTLKVTAKGDIMPARNP